MNTEMSVTLSNELLHKIDQLLSQNQSRSDFIEAVLRTFIAQHTKTEQNIQDLEIINRAAERLNEEALDVLDYRVTL